MAISLIRLGLDTLFPIILKVLAAEWRRKGKIKRRSKLRYKRAVFKIEEFFVL